MISQENIASEAYNIYKTTGNNDNLANWFLAEENLSLFPKTKENIFLTHYTPGENGSYGFCVHKKHNIVSSYLQLANSYDVDYKIYYGRCREIFEYYYLSNQDQLYSKNIYFIINKDVANRVAMCVRHAEKLLNLKERTKFKLCDQNRIKCALYICPSNFWHEQSIRISLFTLLIRSGINYYDDVIKAVRISAYSSAVLSIKRFLIGYTHYTGPHHFSQISSSGWVFHLGGKTEQQLESLLQK